ncbi:threonine--tRNA ligase [Methanimicrococcus blatticola]|uniref:Threonine--tRNA ligase n=1 Tax=Methanimicrococcus blatticola TaxID=91560 RepID=A0A484F6K6_9EURY|nr:threonine--tRNA ligase [Methanimicrococcus blatticola]MBZ3934909.1 threonine--tRNA ligase [Methanimicrococcus blatticola]MCC2508992.1 threonine--tRNA ligase [Methanimicrococcus blatticola]TDQ70978.1 threonyl-tRNA synthetase [Methanimicrococcus blatticola]
MQMLLIHSDYIEYETKKKTKIAEEISDDMKSGRLEEALTAFIAVEKCDEANSDGTVAAAVAQIKNTLEQVKSDKVMVYPYAHLSSSLSAPDVGVSVLKGIAAALEEDGLTVKRAPFGWYKAFQISCKGHPLSELSKHICVDEAAESASGVGGSGSVAALKDGACGSTVQLSEDGDVVSEALKAESVAKSYFKIMDPSGVMHDVDSFDLKNNEKLQKFVNYEVSKNRAVNAPPPHVELMKRLELADYEPGSDSGNMRYYPKGRLMKSLLENYVIERSVTDFGAMEVETPIMYDMNHPTLKKYLDRFPARQYSIESDKRHMFLRFAACFGQFLMNHDMTISYRNMPLKMIEMTRYSFRKEQRGELVGLRRLRAFTMPDMHTLCRDMDEAKEQFFEQYEFCIDVLNNIGIDLDDFEIAIRFTKDFYNENKELIEKMVQKVNKPVLIEMWDTRFFYFVLKFEFNFVDTSDKASALSTVQIDVENAERYDITYTDSDGEIKRPTVLHCSPSGAIERCIYGLLEKAAMGSAKGEITTLPVWLSPTQVRVIPVSEKHTEFAENVASAIKYRVDYDDRELTLGKKVREAGTEWIPYTVVIGDKEAETGKLTVTIRAESQPNKPFQQEMTVEELNDRIGKEIAGMPYRGLALPKYMSKRAKFV